MFHEFPAIDYTDPAHDRRTGRPLIEIDRTVDLEMLPEPPSVFMELLKVVCTMIAGMLLLFGLAVWHMVGWI